METGKIIVILGLAGSGKSYLSNKLHDETGALVFDEGFIVDFPTTYTTILDNLKKGKDCIIADVDLRTKDMQQKFREIIIKDLPQIDIVWKCFENEIKKANINLKKRTNKGDPLGHMAINSRITQDYNIPDNAEIIPITTDWDQ